MRTAILVVLVGASAVANAQDPVLSPPAVETPVGQVKRGFAFEGHLGTQLVAITGVTNLGSFAGGFLLGYKIDRLIVGLGFDIARVASATRMNNNSTHDASTALYVTPGVRVAIVRSPDKRVELFGQVDIGLGGQIEEERPEPTGNQPNVTRFRLFYNLGPGVRFWAHPHFAVSAVTGVHGDFAYTRTSTDVGTTTVSSTQTSTVTSIFAALQLLGVF